MIPRADKVGFNAEPALQAFRRAEAALLSFGRAARRFEDARRKGAQAVLDGGMAIRDLWIRHPWPPFRRAALREGCKALIEHDRLLTDRVVE